MQQKVMLQFKTIFIKQQCYISIKELSDRTMGGGGKQNV